MCSHYILTPVLTASLYVYLFSILHLPTCLIICPTWTWHRKKKKQTKIYHPLKTYLKHVAIEVIQIHFSCSFQIKWSERKVEAPGKRRLFLKCENSKNWIKEQWFIERDHINDMRIPRCYTQALSSHTNSHFQNFKHSYRFWSDYICKLSEGQHSEG